MTDLKLTGEEGVDAIARLVEPRNRLLLVIAEEVAPGCVIRLLRYCDRDQPPVVAMHAPEYGRWRKAMLEGIAILTGGRVIARDPGSARQARVASDQTVGEAGDEIVPHFRGNSGRRRSAFAMSRDRAKRAAEVPMTNDPALPLQILERAAGSDTTLAWERFLTGDSTAPTPARNFVVSPWMRSRDFGIDPSARAAPLAAQGDTVGELRERQRDLLAGACGVFGDAAYLLAGTRSILLLTTSEGMVIEAVGDAQTLEDGQGIHLMHGGDWREEVIGTNGIGTALGTRRPAQVHAAEHFCEGIKSWTCAAAPVLDPVSGAVLGIVEISGPPTTYQRSNLTLARQIEMTIAERLIRERTRLLEASLERLAAADAAGLLAIDRSGRVVHRAGRLPPLVELRIGERLPGVSEALPLENWPGFLPEGLNQEWFNPLTVGGRPIGAMVVGPERARARAARGGFQHSEADPARAYFAGTLGESPALRAAVARARLLAERRVPVLIEGETGVGKELFARAIHGVGPEPYIACNCGVVCKELVAGDLFGHVRGAYTGATAEGRPGRFEQAHGGTLCLDEIGELPLEVQPLLLRALEEGIVYRIGDAQPRRGDVRVLALPTGGSRKKCGPAASAPISTTGSPLLAPASRAWRNGETISSFWSTLSTRGWRAGTALRRVSVRRCWSCCDANAGLGTSASCAT